MSVRPSANIRHGSLLRVYSGEVKDRVDFQFNPTEIERVMSAIYRRPEYPGAYLTPAQFVRFKPIDVKFTIFLYQRGSIGVEQQLSRLELFCSPGEPFDPNDTFSVAPGIAKVSLGTILGDVVVNTVREKRKLFNNNLATTVAEVELELSFISTGPQSESSYLRAVRRRAGVYD